MMLSRIYVAIFCRRISDMRNRRGKFFPFKLVFRQVLRYSTAHDGTRRKKDKAPDGRGDHIRAFDICSAGACCLRADAAAVTALGLCLRFRRYFVFDIRLQMRQNIRRH